MQLSEAARRLLALFDAEGVLIGGICGAIYGIERFTRDVDLAVSLDAASVLHRLKQAGIDAAIRRSNDPGDLSWVVCGRLDDIHFQILPAAETGISIDKAVLKVGLRIADMHDFIASKCIAGGQQDLHDVAVLCLLYPEISGYARETAALHRCLDKLESWLADRRLRQRYSG